MNRQLNFVVYCNDIDVDAIASKYQPKKDIYTCTYVYIDKAQQHLGYVAIILYMYLLT